MATFTDIIKTFVNSIARSKVSLMGAVLTTVTFPILLVAAVLDIMGIVENPYFGFIIYLVLGPLFMVSLLLVFLGLFFFKGKEGTSLFTYDYLKEQFSAPNRFAKVRKLVFLISALTLLNLFILGLISYTGYHYTESIGFCGQLCHTVMAPEYTTYKNSPHSRVRCVECHIGQGAQWFVKSKISGVRQIFAVAFNTYSRPIQTPVHGLRPARETCEQCHRPELFHGDKLYIRDKFLPDEKNTHLQTVLLLKVGSGGYRGSNAHGIHWHVSPENEITYTHTDTAREKISEVRLSKPDGTEIVFSKETDTGAGPAGKVRTMDCVDCHNRPTHIYLPPDEALDQKLAHGDIPVSLPYIKKIALELITRTYASHEEAKNTIATEIRARYRRDYPTLVNNNLPLLGQAISGIQAAYVENVFPEMKIEWNTYRNFLGHKNDSGCFRCHDGSHTTKAGEIISMDCETCHVILAEDEADPKVLETLRGL